MFPQAGNFLLDLSQESPEACEAEIRFLNFQGNYEVLRKSRHTCEITGNPSTLYNAAFIREILGVIYSGESLDGIRQCQLPDGKFHVRFRDADRCGITADEAEIGSIIGGDGKVSFGNPDFVIKVIHDSKWYLTKLEHRRDLSDMESRRPPVKPFFSPVSMHPKFARFMVNVSRTTPGDTIIDPFCGTGGILVEAAIMGRHIIGNDFSSDMIRGTGQNIDFYGLSAESLTSVDIRDLAVDKTVDAVITDLPYGRNSRVTGHGIRGLYQLAFEKFHELLRERGTAVVAVSDRGMLEMSGELFDTLSIVPVRQHKSLTRYYAVLERK
ncbi:MAG: methyltransferase [Candidatus Thermoplasmatota archaeon]|nr:methyltransferase [Candidatus Thermoplasmatota archaeon]MCL5437883.1 methyltransferase [Candidatus Thermoplasmatota archaeon]